MVARLSTFAADVLADVLTGLSTASSAVVTAADTVLAAFGKLQAQITLRTVNTAAAITGGTIDNTVIGGTTATTGNFTSLQFASTTVSKLNLYGSIYGVGVSSSELTLWTGGTLALRNGSYGGAIIFKADSAGINATPIGATTPAAGYFTNIPQGTDIGRNLAHNGQFRVQQRGAGAWTANGAYTADRWQLGFVGDTNSVTIATLADAARTAIGDEAAAYALQDVVTGAATAANYSLIAHKIEDVRRLAGRSITVSFWALGSASLNVGVRCFQYFGTGGSPSANVLTAAQTVAITTTWTRYSVTLALAALTGKTLGSNNDHLTEIDIALSSGTTNATALGVAAQSGTWSFYGVQVEFGSNATPLEKMDIQTDAANCRRFYQLGQIALFGYQLTGSGFGYTTPLSPAMRAAPTMTIVTNGSSNLTGGTLVSLSAQTVYASGACTATGALSVNYIYNAAADL